MITLHQPPRMWGMPNMSPFCVKLETYLRMAKLEYRIKGVNIKKAPNGKIPYIEIDGQTLGDSTLIIDYLKTRYGDSLDARLTPEQQALSLAVKSLIEFAKRDLTAVSELLGDKPFFHGAEPTTVDATLFGFLI